jgi:hypothetical protein
MIVGPRQGRLIGCAMQKRPVELFFLGINAGTGGTRALVIAAARRPPTVRNRDIYRPLINSQGSGHRNRNMEAFDDVLVGALIRVGDAVSR